MTPSYAGQMTLAAAMIYATIRAIKTDGFAWFLHDIGAPPLNKRWLPAISVALGLLGGVASAMAAGVSGWDALAQAFAGLAAGAIPVAAHETIVEGARSGREFGGRTHVE